MVAWAPEMDPWVEPNPIGRPMSTAMSAVATCELSFRWRKSAVRSLVPFGVTEVGSAPRASTGHGLKVRFAPPTPEPRTAVLQGAAPGPPLHPHQLLVAVTVPAPPLSTNKPLPPPVPAE